ncbi:hypothetical protein N8I77_007875 [Diaporthe amygdali]|uniref:Uncharacterized protein n=1 Tax=Phomopsis amygdali TaxID=1214568 RepID=A0AAD9SCI9_PHOAM|nr:hypothetical protein N8I77_007875 [Diaporthe amygdali]
MSSRGTPARMSIIIDLTSDDIDSHASEIIDLTSLDEPNTSSNSLPESKVKVEYESSTLAGSTPNDSGESSPKTIRDDDTTLTESNHTEGTELSPRNPRDESNSSSEDDLTITSILARSKKRKHVSDETGGSQSKSSDSFVPLTREALGSLVGSQPLKPDLDNFWSVRKPLVNEPDSPKPQQNEDVEAQHVVQTAGNTNPQILNIVREEVFGPEKKKKRKHRSDIKSSQKKPAHQFGQPDGQFFSKSVPLRAVSESPVNKTGAPGHGKSSKAQGKIETQRHQRIREPSSREEAPNGLCSRAADPNTTSSKAVTTDKGRDNRCEINGAERSPSVGDMPTHTSKSSARYRPGGLQRNRQGPASARERTLKKQAARAMKRRHDMDHDRSSKHQGKKKYLMAAQDEQGNWGPSGFQPVRTASQLSLKNNLDQTASYDQDEGIEETHGGLNDLEIGIMSSRRPLESNAGQKAPAYQKEHHPEDRELPKLGARESQQAYDKYDQQERRNAQSKLNTAQPAGHRKRPQQPRDSETHREALKGAEAFFKDRYSQLAQKRQTILVDSVPADLGKPSYADRRLMALKNTGRGFGSKRQDSLKRAAEKRVIYRQKAIDAKRLALEAEVSHEFPNESKEIKERRIEAGLAPLRERFRRNDQKRQAQKSHGLLTVEFLEEDGGTTGDQIEQPPALAPKRKQRGIPVMEAFEPGATMTLYAVYISDPVDKGKDFDSYDLKRLADQFLKKEDANKHAEAVLRNDRLHDSHLVSIQFRVGPEDGLFFGSKELADGKMVMCMVQGERHMSSELNLRNVFVEEKLKEVYRPRFDVFYTTVTPKVFLKKEDASTDGEKEKGLEEKTPIAAAGKETEPADKENVDEDSNSLFSAPSTPEPKAAQDEKCESDNEDSDTDSVATDVTLEPSEPGGNLGLLSWNDVEYLHEHVGGFTTLELANQEAIEVARELWRPKGKRMDPWIYYRNSIEPSLREVRAMNLDLEAAELEFEVPAYEGPVKDRPWPFIYSMVVVKETKLEGPRDIGNYIVMDNGVESDEEDEEHGD